MDPAPKHTTIKVTTATLAMLKSWKKHHGLPSMDALFQSFVMAEDGSNEPIPSSAEDIEEDLAPPKRRKIYVQDALYSLELLTERRGMLEFCTGFDRPAVDLLIRRFCEVSRSSFVFRCCCRSETHNFFNISSHPYK
jgi:hypothetical protein